MKKEIRQYDFSEIRMETEQAGTEAEPVQIKKLVGYAARFNSYSQDLGGFVEIIRPGAFKENLGANPVYALANHNRDLILGTTKNGTLKVSEDQYGLRIELTPRDTPTTREWMGHVESGAIDKMSFKFSLKDKGGERWLRGDSGESVRELLNVKLFDVSLVDFPAYESTSVGVRSIEEIRSEGEAILAHEQLAAKEKINSDAQAHREYRERKLHLLKIA